MGVYLLVYWFEYLVINNFKFILNNLYFNFISNLEYYGKKMLCLLEKIIYGIYLKFI